MANLLRNGAEFNSHEDFENAIAQYCRNTLVNGQPVEFIHSSAKYIPENAFANDVKQRLVYQSKSRRCACHQSAGCTAKYKLVLHAKVNGDHVLKLENFQGNHNNHVAFTTLTGAANSAAPALAAPQQKPTTNQNNKLKSVMANIMQCCENMPQPQADGVEAILVNLLDRMQKNVTYRVDFTDEPSDDYRQTKVRIVYDGSETKAMRKKADAYKVIATIDLSDDDDDMEQNINNNVVENEHRAPSLASQTMASAHNEQSKTSESVSNDDDDDDHLVTANSDEPHSEHSAQDSEHSNDSSDSSQVSESSSDSNDADEEDTSYDGSIDETEQVGDSTQNNTVSDDSDNTDALVIEEDSDEDDFLMDLFNDTNKNQSEKVTGSQKVQATVSKISAKSYYRNSQMGSDSQANRASGIGSGKRRSGDSQQDENDRSAKKSRGCVDTNENTSDGMDAQSQALHSSRIGSSKKRSGGSQQDENDQSPKKSRVSVEANDMDTHSQARRSSGSGLGKRRSGDCQQDEHDQSPKQSRDIIEISG